MPRRLSLAYVLVFFVLACIALWGGRHVGSTASARDRAYVTNVVDGDTVHVRFENGKTMTIRLLGIDTPETHHPTKPVGCYGPQAADFSTKELNHQRVELEYDVERHDRYGRTLAYVYIDNVRFNDVLVDQGYARTLTIEPNHKYAHELLTHELSAQKNNRGLWKVCEN